MANRVLVGEEAPRQRFVDDCYLRRFWAVLQGELPSVAYLDAHCMKVVGTDEIAINGRLFSRLVRRTPFDLDTNKATGRPGKRKRTGQAGRLDSGQGPDAIERSLKISSDALWRLPVLGGTGRERERQYAIRIEAFGNSKQAQEALDHQPRADEQDQSQRNFGDHQGR